MVCKGLTAVDTRKVHMKSDLKDYMSTFKILAAVPSILTGHFTLWCGLCSWLHCVKTGHFDGSSARPSVEVSLFMFKECTHFSCCFLMQSVLRSTYHFDDVEQRPGTGSQYGHPAGGHYGPSGTDVLVLDSMAHHPHLPPPSQDPTAPPKLPPLHLHQSLQHPPMTSFSHASSPRRSPTDTPTMGPELGAGGYPGGLPRLDLAGLSAEQLQQQQQHKLHQLQAYDDLWHTHHHSDFRPPEHHARPDLPPLHPPRTSPPASTQEPSMLRVRSRDNLARLGDMAAQEGHPRSTNSSPRHDEQAAAAFAAGGHGEPYTPHPLPPRPPSGGQQGRLGQHTQSESALDMQEGQFGSRLPQPPSMPHLHAGVPGGPLKANLHSEPASPGYALGQYKRASGLEFGESASPHETPRYGRRHSAVEGSSPPMADTHPQLHPSHMEAFRRQHSQHPRSLPGSPRQMEFREPMGDAWHQEQMMSRFAQHGAPDGFLRGMPMEQAGGVGSPGGHLYRGRVGDGSGRWAPDSGLWRAEQAAEMELSQQGYLDMDPRERPYEGAHTGGREQRVHHWLDGQSGEREAHYGDNAGRMPRSASQRQLQEGEPHWQAKAEREVRQDSGARDGLPGLAGAWEEGRRDGYHEDHGEGGPDWHEWQDGRRVHAGWGQDVGRGGMPRRGSNQDLHRTAGRSGDGDPVLVNHV